jgi:polyisoprenoid-binding protein YceI
MKNITLIGLSLVFSLFIASCSGSEKEENQENSALAESNDLQERLFNVDPLISSVNWEGTMVGVYKHTGKVGLKKGQLVWKGDVIVNGSVTIDMSSLTQLDTLYKTEENKLIQHLESTDFFDVSNHPIATFEITGSDRTEKTVSGNLTIRGITNSETVSDVVFDEATGAAKGLLSFDRQKYNVTYKGSTKDMLISDVVKLSISLIPEK